MKKRILLKDSDKKYIVFNHGFWVVSTYTIEEANYYKNLLGDFATVEEQENK